MTTLLWVASTLLAIFTLVGEPRAADQRVIQALQDSGMMRAHGDGSNGGRGAITIQSGAERRAIIQFDIENIATISKAVLKVRIDPRGKKVAGKLGTWLVVNLIAACDGQDTTWIEGGWFRDKFYCANPCKKRPDCKAFGQGATGVTWKCPVDQDISNEQDDCPPGRGWSGAESWVRKSAQYAQEDRDVPIDQDAPAFQLMTKFDVLEFDVTAFVRRAIECGDRRPSFLLRKASKKEGKLIIFSTEASRYVCECNEKALCNRSYLGPTLEITS